MSSTRTQEVTAPVRRKSMISLSSCRLRCCRGRNDRGIHAHHRQGDYRQAPTDETHNRKVVIHVEVLDGKCDDMSRNRSRDDPGEECDCC